jgi:hypothetical protein
MTRGYLEFEFDLPEALLGKLVQVFADLVPAGLTQESLANIPDAQGVYQLYLDDELVYIGKTDAESGLRKRLERHSQKVRHRERLDPNRVSFKAVRILVFTAMDLETQLIDHFGGVSKVPWNNSGFGSNDPGKNRDTTVFKKDHYDFQYPIDINISLGIEMPPAKSAADVLAEVKNALPYVFRFETAKPNSKTPHSDYSSSMIEAAITAGHTAKEIVELIVGALPAGWKATKLPSHLILYKNDSREFPQGVTIATSPVS